MPAIVPSGDVWNNLRECGGPFGPPITRRSGDHQKAPAAELITEPNLKMRALLDLAHKAVRGEQTEAVANERGETH